MWKLFQRLGCRATIKPQLPLPPAARHTSTNIPPPPPKLPTNKGQHVEQNESDKPPSAKISADHLPAPPLNKPKAKVKAPPERSPPKRGPLPALRPDEPEIPIGWERYTNIRGERNVIPTIELKCQTCIKTTTVWNSQYSKNWTMEC